MFNCRRSKQAQVRLPAIDVETGQEARMQTLIGRKRHPDCQAAPDKWRIHANQTNNPGLTRRCYKTRTRRGTRTILLACNCMDSPFAWGRFTCLITCIRIRNYYASLHVFVCYKGVPLVAVLGTPVTPVPLYI